jgi:DNA modification methylase
MPDWQNRIVETADMAVKELKANPKNWRKHPTVQQNALAGILDEVGWVQQVIWNRQTGHLIDGHLRVELAAKRKEKTVPVNVVDLSPEEEAMILATFDPIAAMAEADRQMLQGLMQSIETEDEQIQALLESIAREEKIDLGGEPAEAPEPQVDRAAELQEQWQTAPGQLWQCGDHRVLCGDSTNAEDVARLMGGEKADLVLTDPPYGVAYVGKTKNALTIENDAVSETELAELVRGSFDLAETCCRPGAYWYATVPAGPLHIIFADDWKRRGILRQILVWVKDSMVLGHSEYHYQHEPILFGWTSGERFKNPDRTRTSVLQYSRPKASIEHPTMKPVELWGQMVQDGSLPRENVYDPFLGSGTTLIACEQLGRRCFGLEISPAYVAVILQRWHDMTGRDPVHHSIDVCHRKAKELGLKKDG